MGERKEYTVTIGNIPHRMLLDEADAKRYGAKAEPKEPEAKQSPAPKNKARSADDK